MQTDATPIRILVFTLVLLSLSASYPLSVHGDWEQTEFILGTWWDPCLTTPTPNPNVDFAQVALDSTRFQLARDAYINLLTGTQESSEFIDRIDHSRTGMTYALTIASKIEGLRYLVTERAKNYRTSLSGFWEGFNNIPAFDPDSGQVITDYYKSLPQPLRDVFYGYHLSDEPPKPSTDPAKQAFFEEEVRDTKDWVKHFSENDPTRLSWYTLNPPRAHSSFALRDEYLDAYWTDPDPQKVSDVVCFNDYALWKTGVLPQFWSDLTIAKSYAGDRPMWVTISTIDPGDTTSASIDPQEPDMRFQVFVPIAYGAKGIIYFTFEKPDDGQHYAGALVNSCDQVPTPKYFWVKKINHYISDIVGPVVMSSDHIGTYHKAVYPAGALISDSEMLTSTSSEVFSDVNDPRIVIGEFVSKEDPNVHYLFFVNKERTSQFANVTVTLKGDFEDRIWEAPSVDLFAAIKDPTFKPLNVQPNAGMARTTFQLAIRGGEGRLIKLIQSNPPGSSLPEITTDTPKILHMRPPVPNPSGSSTQISFGVPESARGESYELSVYDVSGRHIRTVDQGIATPGWHTLEWGLDTKEGGRVKSGVYFFRLLVGDEQKREKLLVVQ